MSVSSLTCRNGYVLRKSDISQVLLEEVRKELTAEPQVSEKFRQHTREFPIYWENDRYIGLPLQYARKRFGLEQRCDIPRGEPIAAKFNGTLRPVQRMSHQRMLHACENNGGGILSLPCGFGKCFAAGTVLLRFDGTPADVAHLRPGDALLGDDGGERRIISRSTGHGSLFRVSAPGQADMTVNAEHILCCWHVKRQEFRELTVREWFRLTTQEQRNLYGYRRSDCGAETTDHPMTDHPMTDHPMTHDPMTHDLMTHDPMTHDPMTHDPMTHDPMTDHASSDIPKPYYSEGYIAALRNDMNDRGYASGLSHQIPGMTRYERMCYVSGYVDGTTDRQRRDSISQTIQDVVTLSFGRRTDFLEMYWLLSSICCNFSHRCCGDRYVLFVPRTVRAVRIRCSRGPIVVTRAGAGVHYGLVVSGNGRFRLWDSTVVHNTVTAIALACAIGRKTLIVVHKEFLMRQWIESIKRFSTARIGIIRQKQCAVEDRDIVVGMLQSLASRDYPAKSMDSFGTVIIDECHHMAAPTFSRCLFRTTFRNAIGLSATVERPDGLSHVFKRHIGDVRFSVDRPVDRTVKVLRYCTQFPGTRVRFTYNKNINYVAMISELVTCPVRNAFLIHILCRLSHQRMILVLSERRKHLTELAGLLKQTRMADRFEPKGSIESLCGFYVGGMREEELEDTKRHCRIIFATFQMAEEGFDCRKLNTLVMATPKKRIEQTVGRILRTTANERTHDPLIIDPVDKLSCFIALGRQRMQYYRDQEYRTFECNFRAERYEKLNPEQYIREEIESYVDQSIGEPNIELSDEYDDAIPNNQTRQVMVLD